jgi:hypothetical protein
MSYESRHKRLLALAAIGNDIETLEEYKDFVEPNRIAMQAAFHGNFEVIKLCIEKWECYDDLSNVIWLAAAQGHLQIMIYLLGWYPGVVWQWLVDATFHRDRYNETPRTVCHQREVLDWLKEHYRLVEKTIINDVGDKEFSISKSDV